MSFISRQQLLEMGFEKVGADVQVSDGARFYGTERISLGDRVRIDDFSIISAGERGVAIGNNVHIASHCMVVGSEYIELRDFSGLSSRVSLYSSTDDYLGGFLSNPTIPSEFKNVTSLPVLLEKHVLVGAGCIILPGSVLREGASFGALSLIKNEYEPWKLYVGSPARFVKLRDREGVLEKERAYLQYLEGLRAHGKERR